MNSKFFWQDAITAAVGFGLSFIAILIVLSITIGVVHAAPSTKQCHKHGTVVHCH